VQAGVGGVNCRVWERLCRKLIARRLTSVFFWRVLASRRVHVPAPLVVHAACIITASGCTDQVEEVLIKWKKC
jgi:hypothetical protein